MADPTAALFGELHRRHPDVDLVILPAEATTPGAEPVELAPEDAAARTALLAETVSGLWAAVAPGGGAAEPSARWTRAAGSGEVCAVARVVVHRADGFHLLVGLRHELESRGWAVTRPAGGLDRRSGVSATSGSPRRTPSSRVPWS